MAEVEKGHIPPESDQGAVNSRHEKLFAHFPERDASPQEVRDWLHQWFELRIPEAGEREHIRSILWDGRYLYTELEVVLSMDLVALHLDGDLAAAIARDVAEIRKSKKAAAVNVEPESHVGFNFIRIFMLVTLILMVEWLYIEGMLPVPES